MWQGRGMQRGDEARATLEESRGMQRSEEARAALEAARSLMVEG